jgi:hypothetical protein
MNDELNSLLSLEKRYAEKIEAYESALGKVRDLIELEKKASGEKTQAPISKFGTLPDSKFRKLTKGDAVKLLFEQFGDTAVGPLFLEMKQRGHRVSSKESLRSMLSSDSRFVSRGNGLWGLAQPELSAANGSENGTH